MQSIIIWDSSQPLPQTTKTVITWNGYSVIGSHSLLSYVDKNKKKLRVKYLNWVNDLGNFRVNHTTIIEHLAIEKGFSLWWMSLLVEKSLWKSPSIETAIRMFALEEIILENTPSEIQLVSDNKEVHEMVHSLCNSLKILYTISHPEEYKKLRIRKLYQNLPSVIKAILSFSKYLFNHWNLRNSGKPSWKSGENSVFFCSYFDNVDSKAASQNKFYSFYWRDLHDLIKKTGLKTNWLQLFAACEPAKTNTQAVRLVKSFNQKSEQKEAHAFPDTYLDWTLLRRVCKRYTKLVINYRKIKKAENAFTPIGSYFSLWPIMKQDWKDSLIGPVAINNLLLYEMFDAVIKVLPKQNKGFYLCENQAWERALIFAWKKYGHGKLIAVPHSTRSFWDLRFFYHAQTADIFTYFPMPFQDFTIVNGKASMERFLDENYVPEKLYPGEALRYNYLNSYIKKNDSRAATTETLRILILGDFAGAGTIEMLQQLEDEIQALQVPVSFTLKPHPNYPIDIRSFPSLHLTVVVDDLAKILTNYDIAYSSNATSAAVDAYIAGLDIVVTLDSRQVNLSPLMDQPGVKFVTSASEFISLINNCQNPKKASIAKNNDFFFLNSALPRWEQLLLK